MNTVTLPLIMLADEQLDGAPRKERLLKLKEQLKLGPIPGFWRRQTHESYGEMISTPTTMDFKLTGFDLETETVQISPESDTALDDVKLNSISLSYLVNRQGVFSEIKNVSRATLGTTFGTTLRDNPNMAFSNAAAIIEVIIVGDDATVTVVTDRVVIAEMIKHQKPEAQYIVADSQGKCWTAGTIEECFDLQKTTAPISDFAYWLVFGLGLDFTPLINFERLNGPSIVLAVRQHIMNVSETSVVFKVKKTPTTMNDVQLSFEDHLKLMGVHSAKSNPLEGDSCRVLTIYPKGPDGYPVVYGSDVDMFRSRKGEAVYVVYDGSSYAVGRTGAIACDLKERGICYNPILGNEHIQGVQWFLDNYFGIKEQGFLYRLESELGDSKINRNFVLR